MVHKQRYGLKQNDIQDRSSEFKNISAFSTTYEFPVSSFPGAPKQTPLRMKPGTAARRICPLWAESGLKRIELLGFHKHPTAPPDGFLVFDGMGKEVRRWFQSARPQG